MVSLTSFVKMSKENKIKAIKKTQYNMAKRIKRINKNVNANQFGVKQFEAIKKDIKGLGRTKMKLLGDKDIDDIYRKIFALDNAKSSRVRGAIEINKKMAKTMGEDLFKRLGTNENRTRWWEAFNRLKNKYKESDPEFDYKQLLVVVRDVADPEDADITYEIVDSDQTDMSGNPLPEFRFYKDGEVIGEDELGAFIHDNGVNLNSMEYMHKSGVVFKAGKGYTKNKELQGIANEIIEELKDKTKSIIKRNVKSLAKKAIKKLLN